MYKRSLFTLLLVATLVACNTKEELLIEKGVSLELAEYRKQVLSIVNYKLEFRIPEDYNQKIQALEDLTFNLSDNSSSIL